MRGILTEETLAQALVEMRGRRPCEPSDFWVNGRRAMLLAKLERRTAYLPWTGCWVWEGGLSGNGYGRVRFANRMWTTHRVGWMLLRPEPIGQNDILDHIKERCQLRACWNPDHLEPVSNRTNTLRGRAVLFQ